MYKYLLTATLYLLWQTLPVMTDTEQVTVELKRVANTPYLEQRISEALAQGNIDDAEMYRNLADFIHVGIDPRLISQIDIENGAINKNWRRVQGCAIGFASGRSDNVSEMTCATVADFTLVGDARDFSQQTYRYMTGGEVDEFVYILSVVGIGATVTTVFSGGVAAPAKVAITALKLTKKAGNLSSGLIDSVSQLLKQSFDMQAFRAQLSKLDYRNFNQVKAAIVELFKTAKTEQVADFFQDVHKISQSTSATDVVKIIQYADNTDDVKRLGKLSESFKQHTTAVLKILGKGAIRLTKFITAKFLSFLAMLASLIYSISSFVINFIYLKVIRK